MTYNHVHCVLGYKIVFTAEFQIAKIKKYICIYLYLESQEEELGLIFVFSVFSARNSEHVTTQCRIIICLCCLKFDSCKKAKRIDSLVGEEKEYGIFQREEWKDTESQVQMKS